MFSAPRLLQRLAALPATLRRRLAGRRTAAARRAFAADFHEMVRRNPQWTEFAFVVPLLTLRTSAAATVELTDQQMDRLFAGARNADEAMAAVFVAMRFCDRGRRRVFERAAATLEQVPLEVPPACGAGEVTLLSAESGGSHRQLVFAMAAALLATPGCRRLHLVFTGEWSGRRRSSGDAAAAATLRRAFRRQIGHFEGAGAILAKLDQRLNILVDPAPHQLSGALGEGVIRFEGPAHFRTTFLCGRAIHAARPVVTATFSSVVTRGRNSDLTLVRTQQPQPDQRFFLPPAQISQAIRPPTALQSGSTTIVTAYGEDRIQKGLAKLAAPDWAALAALFERCPAARWLLVGAGNVQAATGELPPDFRARYASQVAIVGFSDLERLFGRSRALLTLPGAFGGGVTAATAIAMGVPVLVAPDPRSDVANAVPADLHVADFADAVATFGRWLQEPGSWTAAVERHQASLRARMDLRAKGEELLAALADAGASRARRYAGSHPY